MREQLEKRLQDLKREFDAGQKMLADFEARQLELQKTLLRISGAIQVLEEALAEAPPEPRVPTAPTQIPTPPVRTDGCSLI